MGEEYKWYLCGAAGGSSVRQETLYLESLGDTARWTQHCAEVANVSRQLLAVITVATATAVSKVQQSAVAEVIT